MSAYAKPLPVIDEANRPYWEGLRDGKLQFLACTACADLRTYAFRSCPRCGCEQAEWRALSGRGHIWSYGIFHKLYFESFRDDLPYNVAVIALEEGPRIYSNIITVPNADIRIGMPVEAVFDPVTDDITLLKFKPSSTAS